MLPQLAGKPVKAAVLAQEGVEVVLFGTLHAEINSARRGG
jgi:hypothetical protein